MQHGEGRVETKVRENGDDIIDFKMPFDQGVKLSGEGAVMSVEDFFKGCDSRITEDEEHGAAVQEQGAGLHSAGGRHE